MPLPDHYDGYSTRKLQNPRIAAHRTGAFRSVTSICTMKRGPASPTSRWIRTDVIRAGSLYGTDGRGLVAHGPSVNIDTVEDFEAAERVAAARAG